MGLANAPGTIALPTSEIGRYALFTGSLAATQQPDETNLSMMCSASVTENLNNVMRGLRDEDEWVWLIGDDHTWKPTALMELLQIMDDNPQIDVLVPLVSKRSPPFHLVLFERVADNPDSPYPQYQPLAWENVPLTGVFEVDAAGSAGMVIRRKVLDAVGDPWFCSTDGIMLNEDVEFCRRAREHGFSIWATSDVSLGHLAVYSVRPVFGSGSSKWGALLEFSSPEDRFKHVFMPLSQEMVTDEDSRSLEEVLA